MVTASVPLSQYGPDIAAKFGLDAADLNLDLGPVGKLM
jgi:hypothetical protein